MDKKKEGIIIDPKKVSDAQVLSGMKIKFQPFDDRVLIKPLEIEMVKKEVTVPDEEANKGKELGEEGDVLETKVEIQEVESNMRKGIVLKVGKAGLMGDKKLPYKEGDTVVFLNNARIGQYFDLYKDSMLLKAFEILGKWED